MSAPGYRDLVRLGYLEGARLESRDLNDLVRYEQLLLALHTCTLHGCSLSRLTRLSGRPRVGHGVAAPGELSWTASDYELSATVSTETARFTRVPRYFPTLAGATFNAALIGPFLRVHQSRRDSFVVRAIFAMPADLDVETELTRALGRMEKASLHWCGVEPGYDELYGAGDES